MPPEPTLPRACDGCERRGLWYSVPPGNVLCPECRALLHIAGRVNVQGPLLLALRVGCAFVGVRTPDPGLVRSVAVRELLACYPLCTIPIRTALLRAVEVREPRVRR